MTTETFTCRPQDVGSNLVVVADEEQALFCMLRGAPDTVKLPKEIGGEHAGKHLRVTDAYRAPCICDKHRDHGAVWYDLEHGYAVVSCVKTDSFYWTKKP